MASFDQPVLDDDTLAKEDELEVNLHAVVSANDVLQSSVDTKAEKDRRDIRDQHQEEDDNGLWLNLPIESSDEDAAGNTVQTRPDLEPEKYIEQYEKLLTYGSKYATPSSETPEHLKLQTPTSHYDYQFSEKDYRRHRKGSHHYHEPLRPLATPPQHEPHRHHHRKHRHKKEKVDKKERKDKDKSVKSPQKLPQVKVLPQIAEDKILTPGELNKKEEPAVPVKDKKDGPSKKHSKHKRHHHHRGISQQDNLESRIRSGLQTLEEEKKAIKGIMGEMDEAGELDHLEEIASHRFENMKGVRRRSIVPRQRSGMTTHIHKTSPVAKPSHMQITLPQFKHNHDPKEGFVELEELSRDENNEYQWRERARWIKFEEDVEKNDRWGKPHVASLSFHSLLELRKGIENGTVLLDIQKYDMESIFELVAENMVTTDQIDRSQKDKVLEVLLSKHRHQHQQRPLQRRFSFGSLSSITSLDNSTGKDSGLDLESDANNKPAENSTTDQRKPLADDSVFVDVNSKEMSHVNDFRLGADSDDYSDDSYRNERQPLGVTFAPTTEQRGESKTVSDVKQRIPHDAEATSVLVGNLEDLSKPAMAFIRLAKGCLLGNLTEVSIPVRFLFVLVGPSDNYDHFEIGRSIATLMSDKIFHDLAYSAKSRDDILDAINSFLDDSVVLAPGDWDRHLLLPLLEAEILNKKKERIALLRDIACIEAPPEDSPFFRTGRFFGGLVRDIRRKMPHYKSDFSNGLNGRCLVTIIFILFATFAPTITFGGLLSKKTDQWLGVIETILATSICGVLFSLCSGQPLIIVGTTGPILVFEQATYQMCKHFDIEFLPWRFWIGLWVMLILWGVVALEGCYLVEYFTRFTEEVFTILISLLFIYEAASFVVKVFKEHPLKQVAVRATVVMPMNTSLNLSSAVKTSGPAGLVTGPASSVKSGGHPNTALMTVILLLGTFFVAFYLRKLRHSHFFSSRVRRIMSDFGVPIAMIVMVAIDASIGDVYTTKIPMPSSIRPTKPERTSFSVNPFGMDKPMHVGWIALALVPALLVSILLFMETELTGVLINKKRNKLRNGGGYNLDLFVMGVLTFLSSTLGLPWMCAATIRSVQHANALAILSRSHAPGERPHLVEIKEQRLTNLVIHALVGLGLFLSPVITHIPFAVLFGVFVYLGVCCLSGVQLVEQVELFFKPTKHRPNKKYVRLVNQRMILVYTCVQLVCLLVLCAIKLTPLAPIFPFVVICMVFVRKQLEKIFTEEELDELDKEEDDEFLDELDEYESVYMSF